MIVGPAGMGAVRNVSCRGSRIASKFSDPAPKRLAPRVEAASRPEAMISLLSMRMASIIPPEGETTSGLLAMADIAS